MFIFFRRFRFSVIAPFDDCKILLEDGTYLLFEDGDKVLCGGGGATAKENKLLLDDGSFLLFEDDSKIII